MYFHTLFTNKFLMLWGVFPTVTRQKKYKAQACDILFNGLCPEEFNKINRLENAKKLGYID